MKPIYDQRHLDAYETAARAQLQLLQDLAEMRPLSIDEEQFGEFMKVVLNLVAMIASLKADLASMKQRTSVPSRSLVPPSWNVKI